MSDKSTTRPWSIGTPTEFGTFNANIVQSPDGAVCMVYRIPQNCKLEDIPEREEYGIGIANAELICKAVNQYDHVAELVEAAKLAAEILHDDPNDGRDPELNNACKRLRSALAKMEVGQ